MKDPHEILLASFPLTDKGAIQGVHIECTKPGNYEFTYHSTPALRMKLDEGKYHVQVSFDSKEPKIICRKVAS